MNNRRKVRLPHAELLVLTALTIALTSCSKNPDPVGSSDMYFSSQARKLAGSWEIAMKDSLTKERDTLWVVLEAPRERRGKLAYSILPDLVVSRLLRKVGEPCEEKYWRSSVNFRDQHRINLVIEDGEGKLAEWRYQGELSWQSDTLWMGTYRYNFDDTSRPRTENWALPGDWQARKVAIPNYTSEDLPKCSSSLQFIN